MSNFKKIELLIGILFFSFCCFHFALAQACQSHTIYGFAFAGIPQAQTIPEGLGWISFSCENQGASINYGVDVLADGSLSGYAFFDMDDPSTPQREVGWIKFDPEGPYPGEPFYSAKIDFATKKVRGWARVCNVFQSGCSGPLKPDSERGGWDGWIKLGPLEISGTDYGVWVDNSTSPPQLKGWAWGFNVVGWIKFNNVKIRLLRNPVARICCQSCTSENCTGYERESFTLINGSYHPDGNDKISSSEWDIIGWGGSPDLKCELPSNPLCNFTISTLSAGNYIVSLKVTDIQGNVATTTKSFTILRNIIAEFKCSLNPEGPWQNCANFEVRSGQQVYFKDESVPSEGAEQITHWEWTFQDGNPSTSYLQNPSTVFLSGGPKNVTLRVRDSAGKEATKTYTLNAKFKGIWYPIAPP